jgi:hypothetical protein
MERRDRLLKQLERNSSVHQRAEEHIAADAGKSVKVCNSHGSRPLACRSGALPDAWWELSS